MFALFLVLTEILGEGSSDDEGEGSGSGSDSDDDDEDDSDEDDQGTEIDFELCFKATIGEMIYQKDCSYRIIV